MTDLIPLDAAIAAITLGRTITQNVRALQAIPTIDPAAIREAAMREALQRIGTLITPTCEDRMNGHEDAYRAIEALIGEKK